VNSCVNTIVDEISSLEWDIIPTEDFEYAQVEKQIKFVKFCLNHPNKNKESFTTLLRALLKDILEIDAACFVKVFDIDSYDFNNIEPKSGAPMLKPIGERNMTEIWVRDGASFLKEIDKFGFEEGFWQYSYQIPAHPMWFNRDEIVYCMEHPRSMSCYGYARTQAVLDIVKSLHYSTLWNKRFFEETSIPDGIISVLDTNETGMENFTSYWETTFKAQPHKIAVANSEVKWTPISTTQKELEFLETQKWYFNIVVSAFGLTPTEMGITETANRAVSATQAELVKRKNIRPMLQLLEGYINNGILPEFGVEGIQFQFIYDDPAEKAARLANWNMELTMGIKTINEVRDELGLEPMAGGDVSNSQREMIGVQGQQDTQAKQEERAGPGFKETKDREESKPAAKSISKAQSKYLSMSLKELVAEHKKLVDILEHGTDAQIKAEAVDQKKELEDYIDKLDASKGVDDGQYYRDQGISMPIRPSGAHFQPQNNKPTNTALPNWWTSMQQANTRTDTDPSHLGDAHAKQVPDKPTIVCPNCGKSTLATISSLDQMQEDIRCTSCGGRFNSRQLMESNVVDVISTTLEQYNISNPVYAKSFDKSVDDIDIKSYTGLDINKSLPYSMDYISSKSYKDLFRKLLNDLDIDTQDKIMAVLKIGMRSGATLTDMSNKINEFINDPERARVIARTEVVRISNQGNLERMHEKGTKMTKFISAPEDGRLCEDCKKHDGKIYTVAQSMGVLPLHPNCRCLFTEFEDIPGA
jgi:SPP1 gp7 family putative phage head morphogenesis protein